MHLIKQVTRPLKVDPNDARGDPRTSRSRTPAQPRTIRTKCSATGWMKSKKSLSGGAAADRRRPPRRKIPTPQPSRLEEIPPANRPILPPDPRTHHLPTKERKATNNRVAHAGDDGADAVGEVRITGPLAINPAAEDGAVAVTEVVIAVVIAAATAIDHDAGARAT